MEMIDDSNNIDLLDISDIVWYYLNLIDQANIFEKVYIFGYL